MIEVKINRDKIESGCPGLDLHIDSISYDTHSFKRDDCQYLCSER